MKRLFILALLLSTSAFAQTVPAFYFGQLSGSSTAFPTVMVGNGGRGSGVTWTAIEPNHPTGGTCPGTTGCTHTYVWTTLDQYVATSGNHGVTILWTYEYAPAWATGTQTCTIAGCGNTYPGTGVGCGGGGGSPAECTGPVTDLVDMDAFAVALATRYNGANGHGTIINFELANESFTGEGSYSGTKNQFATEKNNLRTALLGANANAIVGCCGEAAPDDSFIPGGSMATLWTDGLSKTLGFVSFHGYPHHSDDAPEYLAGPCVHDNGGTTEYGFNGGVNCVVTQMTTSGVSSSIPIWMTEGSWGDNSYSNCMNYWSGGYATGCYNAADPAQSAFVARYMLEMWSAGTRSTVWYSYNIGTYGILDAAAKTAWNTVYGWMVGATISTPCATTNGIYNYGKPTIVGGGTSIMTCGLTSPTGVQELAVWNMAGPSSYTALNQYVQYVNLAGTVTAITGHSVPITIAPVLLLASNTLTVTVSGNGTVTSSPAGISCPPTCTGSFTGTVTLTEAPSLPGGNGFQAWGGACSGNLSTCGVNVTGNVSVTATFVAPYGLGCVSSSTIPPPTVAPFSGITGAGTLVSNPEPSSYTTYGCFGLNNPIVRVTDGNTSTGQCTAQSGSCPSQANDSVFTDASDGEDNNWSTDSSQFAIINSSNAYLLANFVPSSMTPTVCFTATGSGVGWFTNPVYSRTTAKLVYSFSNATNNGHGAILKKYVTTGSCPLSTPSATTVYDFTSGGNGVPSDHIYESDSVNVNKTDTIFIDGFSTSGTQNTADVVASYTVGCGVSTYNTATGTITSDCGASGTAVCVNCPGGPISPGTFLIHNVKATLDGKYAEIHVGSCSSTCFFYGDPYYWQIGTLNVYNFCKSSGDGTCSGHGVSGFTGWIAGNNTPFYIQKAAKSQTGTVFPTSYCSTKPGQAFDTHPSWWENKGADLEPFFTSTTAGMVNPTYNMCTKAEIISIVPPTNAASSGLITRYAHNYGAAVNQFAGQNQLMDVSQDGQFAAMTSPMANSSTYVGQLGDTSGNATCTVAANCRSDVFVVRVAPYTAPPPAPIITTPSCSKPPCPLTSGVQGTVYSFPFAASGGTPPYTWTESGTLPSGLSLTNTGCGSNVGCNLAGTPTVNGNFPFTIQVCDTIPTCTTLAITLAIAAPPLVITNPVTCGTPPCPLTNGNQGAAYSFLFTAVGGQTPYAWSVLSGTLPAGLSLSSTGCGSNTNCNLQGTPTASGTTDFTIQVCDHVGTCTSLAVSLTIVASPVVFTSPPVCGTPPCLLPGAAQSIAYSFLIAAGGGTAPYTFSVSTGSLPAGLSLSSTSCGANTNCNIQGTPSGSGTTNFTIQACDSLSSCTTLAVSLTVTASAVVITNPVMCGSPPCPLTPGVQGTPYSFIQKATGGTGPYTWSVTVGSLPTGLSESSTGCGSDTNCNIQGTPSGTGTSNFTIRACDTLASCTTLAVSITIAAAPISITAPTCGTPPCILTPGTQGIAYSSSFTATGGISPYAWTISNGTAPSGLSLTSTGCSPNTGCNLAGTPTGSGISNFTLQVCDTQANCATVDVSLNIVAAPALTITFPTCASQPCPLPGAAQGIPYGVSFAASGGTAPYTWSILSGNLPPGLMLGNAGCGSNIDCNLSGTPIPTGSRIFTIQVCDTIPNCVNEAVILNIAPKKTTGPTVVF